MANFIFQVADEVKYIQTSKTERTRQLHELHTRLDENSSTESSHNKAFEDEIQSSLSTILASDDSRRAAYQLTHDEEQQNVAVIIQISLSLCVCVCVCVVVGSFFLFSPLELC